MNNEESKKLYKTAKILNKSALNMSDKIKNHELLLESIDASSKNNYELLNNSNTKFQVTLNEIKKDKRFSFIILQIILIILLIFILFK